MSFKNLVKMISSAVSLPFIILATSMFSAGDSFGSTEGDLGTSVGAASMSSAGESSDSTEGDLGS